MKLKLIVLAGAKEGLEIPLKKDKFLIGRAKECALRAGSDAISRQHCAITRHENHYTVRDLGSRNGTYVNDERISTEVPLVAGNELRVGPLKFRIDPIVETPAAAAPSAPAIPKLAPAAKDLPRKQPPVKDVADVVQRTINKSDNMSEDDVSNWLLGIGSVDGPETLKETKSLRAEDTGTTISRVTMTGNSATVEDIGKLRDAANAENDEADAADGESAVDADEQAPAEEEGSGVWKFFKRGKPAPSKKKIGKLPPRTDQGNTKDSRSAAADILREMQRRR